MKFAKKARGFATRKVAPKVAEGLLRECDLTTSGLRCCDSVAAAL